MILRVALDVPVPKLFDYRAEDVTPADIGRRVVVPFGKKRLVGLIIDIAAESEVPASRLRVAETILREVAPLEREWLELVKFCSSYYHRPLGEVTATALPPRLRAPGPVPDPPSEYALTQAGRDALAAIAPRARRLRALLTRLAAGAVSEADLRGDVRGARALLTRGVEAGWIVPIAVERPEPRFEGAHELTPEQREAVGSLRTQ